MRKFLNHVVFTFGSQLLVLFINVGNAAIIARCIGVEGKGVLALAILVSGIFGLLMSGGIGVANVHFAGSKRLNVQNLTANSMVLAILSTILGVGIVGIMVSTRYLEVLVPGVPLWLIILVVLGFPAGMTSGYFSTILQRRQRITIVNIVNLVSGLLSLALTILMVIVFQLGLLGGLIPFLIGHVFGVIAFGFFIRKEVGAFIPILNLPVMRSTFLFAMKAHIGNVIQFFNYRLYLFIVNFFIGPFAVRIYSVAARLSELLFYLPNAVSFFISPKAAASRPEGMPSHRLFFASRWG